MLLLLLLCCIFVSNAMNYTLKIGHKYQCVLSLSNPVNIYTCPYDSRPFRISLNIQNNHNNTFLEIMVPHSSLSINLFYGNYQDLIAFDDYGTTMYKNEVKHDIADCRIVFIHHGQSSIYYEFSSTTEEWPTWVLTLMLVFSFGLLGVSIISVTIVWSIIGYLLCKIPIVNRKVGYVKIN